MDSIIYILFYIGISLIVPLSINNRSNSYYSGKVIFAILLFCIIKGFVFDTATDYMGYYDFYADGISKDSEHMESIFKLSVSFLSNICSSPILFFSICAFLNTYVMIEIGRYYDNCSKQILLLWPIFMLSLSLNLYRQYIAIAFLVLFFVCLLKGQRIGAILYASLSMGFHTSAVIGVLLIIVLKYLSRYIINKWIIIISIICTTILSSLFLDIILAGSSLITLYYHQQTGQMYDVLTLADSAYTANTLQYFSMIANCMLIWCIDGFVEKDSKDRILYYMFAIGLILTPILREQILIRVCLYLTIFTPVLLGYVMKHIKAFTFKGTIFYMAVFYHFSYFLYNMYNMEKEFPLLFNL